MDTLSEPDPINTSASDHVLRLLLPFFMPRNQQQQAADLLGTLVHKAKKDWPCWETPADIPLFYKEETLLSVRKYLLGNDDGSCRYLKVPTATADFWFKKGGGFCKPQSDPHGKGEKIPINLATPGIELFLSPHGVGIFSVTFEPKQQVGLSDLQECNYRLSQLRGQTRWHFSLPHSEQTPEPPPAIDAPLTGRLGKAGGAFNLLEWVTFLLQPLEAINYQLLQQQFNVYSVTRFTASAVFTHPDTQTALRPYLTALAHVEERNHVGSLSITEQVLNPSHWAVVGSLGAAHLLADQHIPPKDFDGQRLAIALHKYFIPYLLGLMQRTILQGILEEARDILVSRCGEAPDDPGCWVEPLRRLNRHTLAFTVNGWFTEISGREALNQYYTLAQHGLRVQDSFRTVQRALHDAEVMDNDRFQNDTLEKMGELAKQANHSVALVAHVQSKVEWLEVFFVSYYATALVYYINHDGALFGPTYSTYSLIGAPVVSALAAFFGLSPHKLHHHHAAKKSGGIRDYGFLIALASIFALWLGVGFAFFSAPPHPAAARPETSHAATPEP